MYLLRDGIPPKHQLPYTIHGKIRISKLSGVPNEIEADVAIAVTSWNENLVVEGDVVVRCQFLGLFFFDLPLDV